MKKKWFKNSFGQTLFSMMILGVFIIFGVGSLEDLDGSGPSTRHLDDGRIETTYKSNNTTRTYTGKQDKYGRWDGLVVIESNGWARREEVDYVDGMRHGKSIVTSDKGHLYTTCYSHGYRVECEKAAYIVAENPSAFEIIKNKYPWFLVNLTYYGYEDEFVEAYLDTMEIVLNSYEFEVSEFDDFYGEALDDVDGNVYDSIIYVNSLLSIFDGLELLKSSEFRMAVIDRYWSGNTSTYNNIINTYPNYLLSVNDAGIENKDFESFCQTFDSLLATYGELNVEDSFFLDSLDNRMFRAMEYISSDEESSSLVMLSLKSSILTSVNSNVVNIWNSLNPMLKQLLLDSSPSDVSAVVMSFMLFQFTEADIVKKAVQEAYFLQNGIAGLPTATTGFSENNSSTSVSIRGIIIEDGGEEVTERGIAWASFYNPSLNEQTVRQGSGTGDFIATITGLVDGQTYYARTYATNSAGTAYGNCIRFVAGTTVGIESMDLAEIDFNVYPNPASDMVTFSFNLKSSDNIVLNIVNMNGQLVENKELNNLLQGENKVQLYLSNFENGIYTCKLTNNSTLNVTQKIMIAH